MRIPSADVREQAAGSVCHWSSSPNGRRYILILLLLIARAAQTVACWDQATGDQHCPATSLGHSDTAPGMHDRRLLLP